jgi:hypothetical protein
MFSRENAVWDALERVEEKYGLEHDFDYVHVQDLGDRTPAMTHHDIHGSGDGDTHLVVDNYLDRYGDQGLEAVITHEILHSNQFNGDFGEVMQEQYGVSDELGERLNDVWREGDRDEIEGMTQALTNKIVDNGEVTGRYFYPYETQAFEKDLETEGIDLDEEFDDDFYDTVLEEDTHSLNGRLEIGDGFVYQQMDFDGTDYEMILLGDAAESYIEELEDRYGLDTLNDLYGDDDFDPDGDDGFYFDDYRSEEYGEGENLPGNIDQMPMAEDSASMGTGPGFSDQFGEV